MIKCYNDWFVLNGNIFRSENFKMPEEPEFVLYEVLRVIDGVPIFLEDHLERLINSAKLKNLEKRDDQKLIIADINSLIKINQNIDGNIRYSLFIYKNEILRYANYTKHEYPSAAMYEMGVKLKSLQISRPEPNLKAIHSKIKERIDKILMDKSIYEIALVDANGFVTEGSRSNLFFIRGNKLFTSQDNQVLLGITRKHVIDIAISSNIELVKDDIIFQEISLFESAFLTGTSPKILPVLCIDDFKYYPDNRITKSISKIYDDLIKKYIEENKTSEHY
jgi:branched-chain amino acid aminotransferase